MATVKAQERPMKAGAPRQVVFSFDEGAPATRTASVRGGKGAYLAEMTALGLPVPPGFTVTTTVSRAFLHNGHLPNRVSGQINRAMQRLEQQAGKRFGDPDNPLLVSVRSGAQASMPGMMDTVLNVGLNPSTVAGLAALQGEQFALDAYCRFLVQFGAIVLKVPVPQLEYVITTTKGDDAIVTAETLSKTCERLRFAIEILTMKPVPDDPAEQLTLSLNAIMRSWMSERAVAYRHANRLPDWWGTAANVQAMVFGNRSDASGTGVVFSHDINTGHPGLYGEFLPKAQGEDIVAGTHTPLPIAAMAQWNSETYDDLERLVYGLSEHFGDIVDVEFTVEDGQLFLLQVRRAKRTALASVTFAVHQVWAGRLMREAALERVSQEEIQRLTRGSFDPKHTQNAVAILRGLAASPGAAVGCAVFSSARAQEWAAKGKKVILFARDTTPDDLPGMLCAEALVTGNGGATCHAAIVARDQGLPAVVGVGANLYSHLAEGTVVAVDGTAGVVYAHPIPLCDTVLPKEATIFLGWHARFVAYPPRIGFEWRTKHLSVNKWLTDFYVSDLMAAASRGTELEREAAELKVRVHRDTAEMLACYLALAIGAELRHAVDLTYEPMPDGLADKFREYGYNFSVCDRHDAQQVALRQLENQALTTQLEFFQFAERVFSLRWSASFGGRAWAVIAQAMCNFLSGKWTVATFVDHVFDLRHNGKCLFDKHSMVNLPHMTDEILLSQQLNIKQRAAGNVRMLYDQLVCHEPQGRYADDVVTCVYKKGLATIW